jgi:hypothetical protein
VTSEGIGMESDRAQRQYLASAGIARAGIFAACAMPANGSWSSTPILGVTTDPKHVRPRRLRVTSP